MKKPTEQGAALVERFGLKGWQLHTIADNRSIVFHDPGGRKMLPTHCDYCKTRICYVCVLVPPDSFPEGRAWEMWSPHTLYVGSECLRSFVPDDDATDAIEFYRRGWRQRGSRYYYFTSRKLGRTIVTAQARSGNRWWIALPPNLDVWDATPWADRRPFYLNPWRILPGGVRVPIVPRDMKSVTHFARTQLLGLGR